MVEPVRLILSRRKGFDLQSHSQSVNGLAAVNVARPTTFGNPFVVGKDGTAAECVEKFEKFMAGIVPFEGALDHMTAEQFVDKRQEILKNLDFLRGKNLACWCKTGHPCHAKVLLELANRLETEI